MLKDYFGCVGGWFGHRAAPGYSQIDPSRLISRFGWFRGGSDRCLVRPLPHRSGRDLWKTLNIGDSDSCRRASRSGSRLSSLALKLPKSRFKTYSEEVIALSI